ncbi:hypothetical protein HDU96_001355 [Phlyctochytrium bullatum]|nr:hypothetical protein HDU96_001355 [Phlyctochytrium bullatum]
MAPDGGDDRPIQPSQSNDTLFDNDNIEIELDDTEIDVMTSDDLNMDIMDEVVASPPSETVVERDEFLSHASQSEGTKSVQEAGPSLSESLTRNIQMPVKRKYMEVIDLTVPETVARTEVRDPMAASAPVIVIDDAPMAVESAEEVQVIDSDDESIQIVNADDLNTPSMPASMIIEVLKADSEAESPTQDEALAAIPNCYRILEVFKDHGSNGLVDKIIIAQESIRRLCNRMAKSSFQAISKIDFDALAKVDVHFAGVYGNREPLAKLLLHLNAITQETFENLLDPGKNTESSWLKNGLYVLLVPIRDTQYAGLVFHWPEQGCYYDDASNDLKKNMVDEDDTTEDSDAENMFFKYSVTRNQERQQDFVLRDGFRLRHPLIQNSYKPAVSIASGTYFSVLTSEHIAEERKYPHRNKEGSLILIENTLKNLFSSNRVILGESLDDTDVEEILRLALPRDDADALVEPLKMCKHDHTRMIDLKVDTMSEQLQDLGEKKIDAFLLQFATFLKMTFPKLEAFAEDKGKVLAELVPDDEDDEQLQDVKMEVDTEVPSSTGSSAPKLDISEASLEESLSADPDAMDEDLEPPARSSSLGVKMEDDADVGLSFDDNWLRLFKKAASEVNYAAWREAKQRLFFCQEFVKYLSEGKETSPLADARMIADLFMDEARDLTELRKKCFQSYSLQGQDGKDDPPKAKNRSLVSRFMRFFSEKSSEGSDKSSHEMKIDIRTRVLIKERASKAHDTTSDIDFFHTILEYIAVARKSALIDASEESSSTLTLCTEVAQHFSLIYQEARENWRRKFKEDFRREIADEIQSEKRRLLKDGVAERCAIIKSDVIPEINRMLEQRSIGNREACIESFTQISRPRSYGWISPTYEPTYKLRYRLETIQPPKIRYYAVRAAIDQAEARILETNNADEAFVPNPRLRGSGDEAAATFFELYPTDMELFKAFDLQNKNFLVFLRELATGATHAYYGPNLRDVGTLGARPWKKYVKPITHIAFDEGKGLLAFYDKETAYLNIMCFDETFRELFTKYAKIEIARWYNDEIPDISDIVFIPGSEEICFVERMVPIDIVAVHSPSEKKVEAHIYFCSRLANKASKVIGLPAQITPNVVPQLQMVHLCKRQLHLVCVTEGMLQSIIANVTLERHRWQFKADKKRKELIASEPFPGKAIVLAEDPRLVRGIGTRFTANARIDDFILVGKMDRRKIISILGDEAVLVDRPLMTVSYDTELEYVIEQRSGSNSLLNVYQRMYTKFPIQSCVEKEAKDTYDTCADLRISSLPEELFEASASAEELSKFQKYATSYFKSSFADLKRTTSKNIKPIAGFEVVVKRQSEFQRTFFESCCKLETPVSFSEWLLAIFCLIPIQIAMANDNRFVPLSNGIVSSDINQEDTASIAENISFGWYESILEFCREYEVKVVSSMGEQSCGKSYMLNHLLGTAFDGSAMRCTEGAWMSLSLDHSRKTIYVGLDFEGLQSIERSHQEDAMLAVFNCAVSNLVLMKTHFSLGRDLTSMFQRFQDGATLFDATSGKKMFTSQLALIIKDVAEADMRGIVEEFESKFAEMVAREEEDNFVSRLHGNGMTIWPYPLFNNPAFYSHFAGIKKLLDEQPSKYPKARLFAQTLKLIMAKLNVCDWTSLDANLLTMRCSQLKLVLPCAVAFGLEGKEPFIEQLKSKDSGDELFDSAVSNQDSGLLTFLVDAGIRVDLEDPAESLLFNSALEKRDAGLPLLFLPDGSDAGDAHTEKTTQEGQDAIMASYLREFDQLMARNEATSDERWVACFQKYLDYIVFRRVYRVQKWLSENTNRFPQDHAEITNLKFELQQIATQLRLAWKVCGLTCDDCRLKCLLAADHNGPHSCKTDHKCHHLCRFLADHDSRGEALPSCGFNAGHEGDHMCGTANHLCGQPCLLAGRRNCQGSCTKTSDHDGEHMCQSRVHYCGLPCSLANVYDPNDKKKPFSCSNTCVIPCEEEHDFHKCENNVACPIKCPMPGCALRCQETNHFHALDENAVHQCAEEHRCLEQCEAPGICRIDHKPQICEETYTNRHGSFSYKKFVQVHQRLPCSKTIPPNQVHHDGPHVHTEKADEFHYCEQRCPFCSYFCMQEVGHDGLHDTNHGSMSATVFTHVEDEEFQFGAHKFNRNDSGKCFLCQLHCKDLKRHHHVDWCRHPDQPHLCKRDGCSHINHKLNPDPDRPKDMVTHETYWKRSGFKDPYSEEDRQFFSKCEAECWGEEHNHVEGQDNTQRTKSYCILPMFHDPVDPRNQPGSGYVSSDGHQFSCVNPAKDLDSFHIVFVLDRSSSMQNTGAYPNASTPHGRMVAQLHNNQYGATLDATYRFCLTRNATVAGPSLPPGTHVAEAPNTRDAFSVILFDKNPMIFLENAQNWSPTQMLQKLVTAPGVGFGTRFSGALQSARAVLERNFDQNRHPVVIFLSDGEAAYPKIEIEQIILENNARGSNERATVLEWMANYVKKNQKLVPRGSRVPTGAYYNAIDEVSLSEHFIGLAQSLKSYKPSLLIAKPQGVLKIG